MGLDRGNQHHRGKQRGRAEPNWRSLCHGARGKSAAKSWRSREGACAGPAGAGSRQAGLNGAQLYVRWYMLYPTCAVYSPTGATGSPARWKGLEAPYREAPATAGPPSGKEMPKAAGGSIGLAAIFSFSSSASWSRLALARRFWNQIFTWVSVRLSELENSARSAMDRYCFCRNFLSRARSWAVVKGVRGFLFVLCLRRVQAGGLSRPVPRGRGGRRETPGLAAPEPARPAEPLPAAAGEERTRSEVPLQAKPARNSRAHF